jgi:NAD(P)-dependent dehydrogenase (short-subunit alcohol dehydrogenase family)
VRDFQDRGAVVTGAGSGMGRATAIELASRGASVLVFDRDADAAAETVSLVERAGGRAVAGCGDVACAPDLEQAVATAVARFGALDVMVNFAGIMDGVAPCIETTESLWDRVLEVNLKGTFLGTRAALREMLPRGRGAIVNMSSYAGFMANGGGTAYAASKAAIIGLTRQVAFEAAPIRVNAVAPGLVWTGIFEKSAAVLGDRMPGTPGVVAAQERLKSSGIARIPLRRGAEPTEIARLAAFLASDAAGYITGQTYQIDGGGSLSAT